MGGFLLGIIFILVLGYILIPRFMIETKESRYDYDATIKELEKSIISAGWNHKGTLYISDGIKEKTGEEVGAKIGAVNSVMGGYVAKEEKLSLKALLRSRQ